MIGSGDAADAAGAEACPGGPAGCASDSGAIPTTAGTSPPVPPTAAVIRRAAPSRAVQPSPSQGGQHRSRRGAEAREPTPPAASATQGHPGKRKASDLDDSPSSVRARRATRKSSDEAAAGSRDDGEVPSAGSGSSPSVTPSAFSKRSRPRWHNANYLLFLALKQHPQKAVPRTELMRLALALDEKISREKGWPKVFRGKTPMNTASATLTCNSDKLFVSFRPEGSRCMWFKLAFEPADFHSAVAAYDSWVRRLTEHDWPLCFGKRMLFRDDRRTRAIPGLEERLEKWERECRQKKEAYDAEKSSAPGTPPRPTACGDGAQHSASPGSDKENKDDEEAKEEVKAGQGIQMAMGRLETRALLSDSVGFAETRRASTQEQQCSKVAGESSLEASSAACVKSLAFSDANSTPDDALNGDAVLGTSSKDTAKFPKGDPRNYISPFPEGLDLTQESRAEVLRLSPEVIEIFIPEPCPPTDWRQILRVGPSTIAGAGDGLFATRPIPIGVPLGFYFGIPMTEDEFDSVKDGVGLSSDYSIMYRRTVLDATDEQGMPFRDPAGQIYCPFHFMNEDVDKRNVAFTEGVVVNQVIVFTTRAIEAGEELFVDYGKDVHRHWKSKPPA